MKRQATLALLVLWMVFASVGPAAVTSHAAAQTVEDSLVDVWVFEDADQNGVYSSGDHGFTDINVCLFDLDTPSTSCVGTDEGDTWWEINQSGSFSVSVSPSLLAPTYKLNSIVCQTTRTEEEYDCNSDLATWQTGFDLPLSTRINVFYGVVKDTPGVIADAFRIFMPFMLIKP